MIGFYKYKKSILNFSIIRLIIESNKINHHFLYRYFFGFSFIYSFVIFMILFFVSFLKEEILRDKRGGRVKE
ncbi:hypothetical protein BCD_0968 (plasmid) [Borrelia crocidurae DOU]|uniref:Uncharacterized protein n=2 Tax=Borrelia crocidurae TaxID=29520 RepID=W5SIQ7_9SPIR|nr:hypothetical protein Q7M_1204 [Borrelia crocidurae str. Achema]AHH07034.1 hypothetical protein BCD_0968 [Borrelia crocidurae DOU]